MSETAKPYSNLEIANIFELGAETIRGQMATIENLQAQLREAKTDISCLESKITVERRAGEAAVAQLREKTEEVERLEWRSGCQLCADKRRAVEAELATARETIKGLRAAILEIRDDELTNLRSIAIAGGALEASQGK